MSLENTIGIGPSRGGEGYLNNYGFMVSGRAMHLNTLSGRRLWPARPGCLGMGNQADRAFSGIGVLHRQRTRGSLAERRRRRDDPGDEFHGVIGPRDIERVAADGPVEGA